MSEALPGMPPPPPPARARPAAAVVLWRDGPDGREILWVRRGETLRFAGGFHAFPGGRVDEADAAVPVPGLAGDEAAHHVAACRELFEEAGVLLARGAERLSAARRDEARRALLDGRLAFGDLLFQEGLALDPAALEPAGRWVTPAFFPVRFDARFYLARLPAGQEAAVWPGELSGGEFVSAGKALQAWERVAEHIPSARGLARVNQASLLLAEGEVQDALSAYEQAASSTDDATLIQVAKMGAATCKERLGEVDAALEDLDDANLPSSVATERQRRLEERKPGK